MKTSISLRLLSATGLGCFLLGLGDRSSAQIIYNSASTAQQGALEGFSDVISAQGQANLNNSQAALNMTQVQQQEMQNQLQYTETYYKNREIGRENRQKERGPLSSADDFVKFAQYGRPKPITPSQVNPTDGRIQWPSVLMLEDFSTNRKVVDDVYAKRAEVGTIGFEDQMSVRTATNAMIDTLKRNISKYPPQIYIDAKGFIQSLTYGIMQAG